jgi:hypothetical protein
LANSDEVFLDVPAIEQEDWDYARNMQVLLKTRVGEWSSSVFSVDMDHAGRHLTGPNRDYSHQGLLISRGTDVFKTLDALLFSGAGEGDREGPRTVRVEPSRILYRYPHLEAGFSLRGGCLNIELDREGVEVVPLIDIRAMNGASDPAAHEAEIDAEWLSVRKDGLSLRIGPLEGFDPSPFITEWVYKLGSGFRWKDERGCIRFVREQRRLFAPGTLTVNGNLLAVTIEESPDVTNSTIPESSWLERISVADPALSKPMKLRLSALRNFGLDLDGVWFPEAGCWWFRKPWVRDALEGILANFQVYTALFGWEERLNSIAKLLMKTIKKESMLPTILGGQEPSADAPPLLIYLCSLLNREIVEEAMGLTSALVEAMVSGDDDKPGPPVFNRWLVACAAFQSWTDSRLGNEQLPSRIPANWKASAEDWSRPKYYLPEVNGYWIRALESLTRRGKALGLRAPDTLLEANARMKTAFRMLLWDGSYLVNIMDSESLRRDWERTSMGLVGISSALSLFNREEIRAAYASADRLLVKRSLVQLGSGSYPMGLLITGQLSPYLGDAEYHRSVVWPRDTPYLVRIMEVLGLQSDINGILLNALDQTISEGALTYSSEIYGPAVGANPNKPAGRGNSDLSLNPLPLKNPAQYWSHWCDPFLGRIFSILP